MKPHSTHTIAKYFIWGTIIFSVLTACDSHPESNAGVDNRPLINVGRLICGGHLSLAIVEKKYRDRITSFKLNTVQNHDWDDVVDDIKSGKLIGSFILSPLAMKLISDGFPGKIVLKADINGNGFILSNRIDRIEDLALQKSIIAVPHEYSQHHVLLHLLLKQHDVNSENIKIISMPPRDMINALRDGEIDGFLVGEPEGNRAVSMGIGWLASTSPDIWKNHMDHVFMVSNEFIDKQPEKLQELINYLVMGGRYIEDHPHESAQLGEAYTGASATVFEEVLTSPSDWISFADMLVTDSDLIDMRTHLVDMGLMPVIAENQLNTFADMRYVKRAVIAMAKQGEYEN